MPASILFLSLQNCLDAPYTLASVAGHRLQQVPWHGLRCGDLSGGKFIARKCSEHCWVDEEDIEGRFWKLDETLGPQSLSSGTTASIMVIDHVHGEDFSITLAWVGDSQIMEIDVPLPSPVSVENQPQCKHT